MQGVTTEASAAARRVLSSHISVAAGTEKALLEKVAKLVIKDRLATPFITHFLMDQDDALRPHLKVRYGVEETTYSVHRHALGQMAAKAGIPMVYVNQLNSEDKNKAWMVDLLSHNMNELFHRGPYHDRGGNAQKFLHRIVDGEIRGFLSRKYNRHLASAPMLEAFVMAYTRSGAHATSSVTTPVRFALRAFLPEVYEPIPGEYVAVGVQWSNSDFGAGKMAVTSILKRLSAKRNVDVVLDDSISKVHLGSIIQESDLELSPDTIAKEVKAVAGAISDAVVAQLSDEAVSRLMTAIAVADKEELSWAKVKGQLAKFLYKEELSALEIFVNKEDEIEDLPPITTAPTRWWLTNAITAVAAGVTDPSRRMEIEQGAGELLGAAINV